MLLTPARQCGTLLLLAALLVSGCTARHYRKAADKAAYRAIEEKGARVPNMDRHFTIDQQTSNRLDTLPLISDAPDFLGFDTNDARQVRLLGLEPALEIAVRQNRAYQSRKEQLYLNALTLTLARHRFTPIFGGGGQARIAGQTERAVDVIIDPVTQQPRALLSDSLVEQRRVTGQGHIDASWLIRDVGLVTTSFTTDFLRYLTGDSRAVTSSRVGAVFVRPLLRNAGFKQQMENLTQAERDLLYELRNFAQFRKSFSVQVASAYYAVLGNRDAARNNFLNLLSSRRNAERTRALAREGRVTQADLGRLEQQVLTAENTWNNAVRTYQRGLDDFKVLQLGIPAATPIVLSDRELEALKIEHPEIPVEKAVEVALAARLDLQNSREQQDDAERRAALAANFLLPQLDLTAAVNLRNPPNQSSGFPVPDLNRYDWSAGLDLDLPLDRFNERNSYRAALIAQKRAAREYEQQSDQVQLEIRESWRALEQARRTYEISQLGVELAQRRVEEQNLLAELGRAKAQDQVDAQNDLITSRNQLTQALVTHTIARLQFWANMGILYIKDNGRWRELSDEDAQKIP